MMAGEYRCDIRSVQQEAVARRRRLCLKEPAIRNNGTTSIRDAWGVTGKLRKESSWAIAPCTPSSAGTADHAGTWSHRGD